MILVERFRELLIFIAGMAQYISKFIWQWQRIG